jgi:hypothetical protein
VKRVTRTRRLGASCALALVVLAGAGGCGDDDSKQAQDDPTEAVTSTAETAETATDPPSDPPSESASGSATEPGTPSVTPATGIELVEATSAVRVPAGWEPQDALLDYASAATEPGKLNTVQLADSGSISGGASLDALAEGAIKALPSGADVQRLPDVDLDGVPAFHLHNTVPQDPQEYDVVTTERNGRNVGLDFMLVKKNAATNPDLIASVLATFRWTA